jgi:hypothetical protein
MTAWDGHYDVTAQVLDGLFERAVEDSAAYSNDERALFGACEFWAAARQRRLSEHLREAAPLKLRAAQLALLRLGAVRTAHAVHRTRIELTELSSLRTLNQVVAELETTLAHGDEPVDDLIARFALATCPALAVRN